MPGKKKTTTAQYSKGAKVTKPVEAADDIDEALASLDLSAAPAAASNPRKDLVSANGKIMAAQESCHAPKILGYDTQKRQYNSVEELWHVQLNKDCKESDSLEEKKKRFYQRGASYWTAVKSTYDGVLGGFEKISAPDIVGSRKFLTSFLKPKSPNGRKVSADCALDCGAGVGRITKELLAKEFRKVDLVEQNPAFLDAAKESLKGSVSVGEYFYCGLQEFTPPPAKYDVIWVQWVVGHLLDDDFIAFLKRLNQGLRPGGLIVVKENTSREPFVFDLDDHSITRSDTLFKTIFAGAGFRIVKEIDQKDFPKEIFPVKMYALEPSN